MSERLNWDENPQTNVLKVVLIEAKIISVLFLPFDGKVTNIMSIEFVRYTDIQISMLFQSAFELWEPTVMLLEVLVDSKAHWAWEKGSRRNRKTPRPKSKRYMVKSWLAFISGAHLYLELMGIHIYQNLNLSERDRLRTIKFLLLLIANERLSYISEIPLLLGFLLLQDRRSLDSKFGMKVQTVLIDKKKWRWSEKFQLDCLFVVFCNPR